jgi:hypothetical protein
MPPKTLKLPFHDVDFIYLGFHRSRSLLDPDQKSHPSQPPPGATLAPAQRSPKPLARAGGQGHYTPPFHQLPTRSPEFFTLFITLKLLIHSLQKYRGYTSNIVFYSQQKLLPIPHLALANNTFQNPTLLGLQTTYQTSH